MANRNLKGDVNVQFEEPTSRINLDSGSSVKTLFGRISKWLKDLKAVAFSGSYTDLSDKPTIPPATAVKGNAEITYRTGNVNLTPANIGLGNVNNTSDTNKPISTATQTALNNKVSKTGDSMSGPLTHNGAGTILKNTNLDANGDNPTSNTWSNTPIEYHDKDDTRIGYVNVQRRTDGSTMLEIAAQARNAADTADIYNTIDMLVGRDGARSYAVTDSAAFRKAIGTGNQVTLTGAVTGTGTFDSNGNVASVNTTLNSKLSGQINYNTNNGVKNLLSTEWFATNPVVPQQGTVESYDVKTGSITGFASASLTGGYLGINIAVDKMNNVLENGKTYILSWTVDSIETNTGIFGMRRKDNNAYSVGGSATITRTGNYSVSYTHNSSIPVYFSFCVNTSGLSTDKRIAISNLMLREATIEDSTFEPYAKSNAELTADIPLTIHIDYRNIDVPTCDSTYNECLSALESGRAVIAMIQITSKLMRTCFFGLDTDTKIICGEIPNGHTTYDFDWRAGGDCPSIGISS